MECGDGHGAATVGGSVGIVESTVAITDISRRLGGWLRRGGRLGVHGWGRIGGKMSEGCCCRRLSGMRKFGDRVGGSTTLVVLFATIFAGRRFRWHGWGWWDGDTGQYGMAVLPVECTGM